MIDKEARTALAENILHLAAGVISNDEFEDRIHWNSSDPAIREITMGGPWHLYPDGHKHRLRDNYRITKTERTEAARWVLFLRTDLPYEWPQENRLRDLLWLPLNLLTLGFLARLRQRAFAKHGDISVWPFIRVTDFDFANATL